MEIWITGLLKNWEEKGVMLMPKLVSVADMLIMLLCYFRNKNAEEHLKYMYM